MIRRWMPALLLLGVVVSLHGVETRLRGDETESWVQARVQAVGLTDAERAWEQVGFASDLRQALQLAKEHDRPIFFYAMAGDLSGRT